MNKDQAPSKSKKSFWQRLQEFFIVSDEELKAWKKKNYVSRQQLRRTSKSEDEAYNKEYDKKNARY